jgi:hypothetical protein
VSSDGRFGRAFSVGPSTSCEEPVSGKMPTEPPRAPALPVRHVEPGSELTETASLHHNGDPIEFSSMESNQRLDEAAAVEPLLEEELILDPSRITAIIEALIVHEARGCVLSATKSGDHPTRNIPARVMRDGRLLLECRADDGRFPRPPFRVQLEGYNSVYEFRSSAEGTVSTPESIRRVRRRSHRRTAAPRRLRVTFAHPLLPEVVIDAPAIDVSAEGVSFETSSGDMLESGAKLRNIELSWKGGARIKTHAIVAHVTHSGHSDRQRVGLRLLMDRASLEEWQRQIEGVLHPRTTRGTHDHQLFWQTYVESGYFNLSRKNETDFRRERSSFQRCHELLRNAPEVGASFVRSSEKRVEAVAHQISPWPGSWLFYQFCRLPDSRPASVADDNVLMDLYTHAYEYVQQRPGAEWLVTYVQEAARFSRLVFHGIGERYAELGRASVTRFRAIEVECTGSVEEDAEFDVGPATQQEIRILAAAIGALRPEIYVAATGLGASDLGIDSTAEKWQAAGFERKRQVLVARHSGRPIAGAVLDAADDGLHLFGLLDVARFYPLAGGGCEAFSALLRSARSWFSALGKRRFAYFANDAEHPGAYGEPGCTDLGAAFTIVLPVALLPEMLEHVNVTTSRLPQPARARAARACSNDGGDEIVPIRSSSKHPSKSPSRLPPRQKT